MNIVGLGLGKVLIIFTENLFFKNKTKNPTTFYIETISNFKKLKKL